MTTKDWTSVKNAISRDIDEGRFAPGDQIPTEPELLRRYGVGRHSLRRAISALAKEGKLSVEQGRGTFVSAPLMLHYELGKRTRLRRNLAGQANDISRDLLEANVIAAPDRVRRSLGLEAGALVYHSRRLTSADGRPIAFGSIFHSVDRFPAFHDRRAVFGSVTETYRSYGIEDYLRAETTFHSRQARPEEARMLCQHPDLSVTIIRAVDALPDGTPIACSEVVWAASRVRFSIASGDDDRG
ncbi:MAG: phosphonate metabolism transcriptional regulator PhnF [Rhodobacteraceae bacterium HLUCCA08]|nr:MAG: phosphonate metabolism transcriptional regulator PhnF [Rhodobacteraceae bacterium HLUCCA08]